MWCLWVSVGSPFNTYSTRKIFNSTWKIWFGNQAGKALLMIWCHTILGHNIIIVTLSPVLSMRVRIVRWISRLIHVSDGKYTYSLPIKIKGYKSPIKCYHLLSFSVVIHLESFSVVFVASIPWGHFHWCLRMAGVHMRILYCFYRLSEADNMTTAHRADNVVI